MKKGRRSKRKPNAQRSTEYPLLLDSFSIEQILNNKGRFEKTYKYHWDYLSNLAFQRKQVKRELTDVLRTACIEQFTVNNWFRIVPHKYSTHPLSAKGSLKFPGGRFNIGRIDQENYPSFPALYLAEDQATCIQEVFLTEKQHREFSGTEYALTRAESFSCIRTSGLLDLVLDISAYDRLDAFVKLIGNFSLPKYINEEAGKLGMPSPRLIRSSKLLIRELMHDRWKHMPTLFDIPANSQVFGQIVFQAGIGGILYPSKHTGKKCLAVFPMNFVNTSSFLELPDEPPKETIVARIDGQNAHLCES